LILRKLDNQCHANRGPIDSKIATGTLKFIDKEIFYQEYKEIKFFSAKIICEEFYCFVI